MLLIFTLATFLGAGLVFLVQPMVAKMVLPLLGGSPAVWNTAMVFFQAVLLLGYGYAHISTRLLGVRRQAVVHIALLAVPALLLPIALPSGWSPPADAPPALWLLVVLAVIAGIPYFVVTTASPLLQRWFSGTGHPQAGDPYFLYAAGNTGSLLALLAYPVVVEPNLALAAQTRLWAALYAAFAVAAIVSVLFLLRRPGREAVASPAAAEPAAALPLRTRLRWVAFAFVPSSMFLGTTQYLTTDIAAVPLLWVLPLSLYLLTFILAFARISGPVVRVATTALPFLVVALAITFLNIVRLPIWQSFVLHLVTLLFVGLLCHGRLAEERPPPARLTEFFLLISVGGVLGGVFNALVAPVVFTDVLEYPLVIVAALLVRPVVARRRLLPERLRLAEDVALVAVFYVLLNQSTQILRLEGALGVAAVLAAAMGLVATVWLLSGRREALVLAVVAVLIPAWIPFDRDVLHAERTFFGVYEVYREPPDRHVLFHGTTIHGFQSMDPELAAVPMSYHHPTGPIGDIYDALAGDPRLDDVGVLGLGVGTMAAYGGPGQRYTFYEIDPAVVEIATNPNLFRYLPDASAGVDVVLGDGRLQLADSEARHGLLFLNAFTSDAIPVHLLTREAVDLYLDRVAENGLLVFNVTNRHLDVASVVAGIARDLGLAAIERNDRTGDDTLGRYSSHWVIVARHRADFGLLAEHPDWHHLDSPQGDAVWTDSFANIISIYRWR